MRERLTLLTCVAALTLLCLLPRQATAQYVVTSSSTTFDFNTYQARGVSQTAMDYYTALYYQAAVSSYMYRQSDGALVSSGSHASSPGINTVAVVTTQSAVLPNTLYWVQGRHSIGTLYSNQTFRGQICGSYYPYNDVYAYYQYGYYSYGPNVTFNGASVSACLTTPFINLAITNHPGTYGPPLSSEIMNPRGGQIQGTTQTAMVGSPINFQDNYNYPGQGTHTWTFTGSPQVVSGATNRPDLAVRWMQPGTYTVTSRRVVGSSTATASATINVVLPTMTYYSGNQGRGLISPARACSDLMRFISTFQLGCPPSEPYGMNWTATVQAPPNYISEPTQSGIKYVQAVSTWRKRLIAGTVTCATGRGSESDVNSGWQLDYSDPLPNKFRRFSEGNTLVLEANDYPAQAVEGAYEHLDTEAITIDDRFETYLIYFAGGDPAAPAYQIPLGKITWNWGGLAIYDPSVYTPQFEASWRILNHYAGAGPRAGVATNSTVPYQGRGKAQDNKYVQCPGGPPPATNPIDGARFFVKQQYLDILHRDPDDSGWRAWISVITRCAFDASCISSNRTLTARGFLESPENFGGNPNLANPGSAVYNQEYVRLCYVSFLNRQSQGGEDQGWVNYLNSTGDYDTIVGGFINSAEYRARFGPP